MIRAAFITTGLVSIPLLAAFVAPLALQGNYTAIPPSAEDVQAQLAICKVSLAQAVDTATKSAGGVAKSADVKIANGVASVEVLVYGNGKCQRVVVNGETGAVQTTTEIQRFAGEPVSGAWTETPSGLKYYDIKVGSGDKPADPMTKVKVVYTGWLVDGTKFDSSVDKGQPYVTALNAVIPGWTEGISTMQVGGKRKLIIPAKLGFGDRGSGAVIPPRATLVFDIELLEVLR